MSRLPSLQLSQWAASLLRHSVCLHPRQEAGLQCCLHRLISRPGSFLARGPGCFACAPLWDPSPARAACLGLRPGCPSLGLGSVCPPPGFPTLGWWRPVLGGPLPAARPGPDTDADCWARAQHLQEGMSRLCGLVWPCRALRLTLSTLVPPYPKLCHGVLEGSPGKPGPVLCSRGSSKGHG